MEEEGKVGSQYEVNVRIDANVEKAVVSDSLSDTVDYVRVYEIVRDQMAIRSKLIEHVAQRILYHIRTDLKNINWVEVTVYKLDPPIHGQVEKVGFTLKG